MARLSPILLVIGPHMGSEPALAVQRIIWKQVLADNHTFQRIQVIQLMSTERLLPTNTHHQVLQISMIQIDFMPRLTHRVLVRHIPDSITGLLQENI